MTLVDLNIQERHLDALRALVLREDGLEAAAYILCGEARIERDPWERRSRRRLISYAVLPIPKEDALSASDTHVSWSTASFVRLLRRGKEEGLIVGIVHAHPRGPACFSEQDDSNELELARLARNRNGEGAALLSVLLTGAGEVRARLWPDLHAPVEADPIRVVGQRLTFHSRLAQGGSGLEVFARQALVFGPELTPRLRAMRIGVVGCGGTGSATAMLLARLGVGQLALFDDDIVEATNLNRLHGARRADADAMRPKVDTIAREITEMGLGTRVMPVRGWIGDPACRDALKSCDVIFGCTDDHDGRLLLNRFAYFYLVPVIDMGLAIDPAPCGGVRDLTGRVTVLTPCAPCLLCRRIVDPAIARDEDLRRKQPEEHERRKREAYIRGGGDPAPAVVTFTTATACLAVDEMLQGLTGFRGGEGWAWQRVRRFDRLEDRRPGAVQDPHCPVCSDTGYWGRADLEPFLDRAG